MVLTITLAIMTTDKAIDPTKRLGYFWLLIFINVCFFLFWVFSYMKILLASLSDVNFLKKFLNKERKKESLLVRLLKAIFNCVSEEKNGNSENILIPTRKANKFNLKKNELSF
jgi:hypothetical protein